MVCVSQQDFIELAQCVGRCVEQALASIDCAKPVVRQQASDFRLDFLLLGIKLREGEKYLGGGARKIEI